jgi:hypothetical protein
MDRSRGGGSGRGSNHSVITDNNCYPEQRSPRSIPPDGTLSVGVAPYGLVASVGLARDRRLRVDERLARFDRLVAGHLDGVTVDAHRDIVRRFARWSLRPHLAAKAKSAPLRDAQITNATQNVRIAAALLAWLDNRNTDLTALRQADIDEWFATPPTTHTHATPFLRWAIKAGHCPSTVRLPKEIRGNGKIVDQTRRLKILRQLLDPDTATVWHRVAGVLLVLFGQPYDRIAALPLDAISIGDTGQIGIRLGQGITPVPAPFDTMFVELTEHRPNLSTATNPDSPWLFPGRIAGRHISPAALRNAGIAMGIDLTPAKRGALRALVTDCPPPVIADMLGYSYQTLDHHAQAAGSPYRSYAAHRASRS